MATYNISDTPWDIPQPPSKLGFACPSPLYKYVNRHPSILNNMAAT